MHLKSVHEYVNAGDVFVLQY